MILFDLCRHVKKRHQFRAGRHSTGNFKEAMANAILLKEFKRLEDSGVSKSLYKTKEMQQRMRAEAKEIAENDYNYLINNYLTGNKLNDSGHEWEKLQNARRFNATTKGFGSQPPISTKGNTTPVQGDVPAAATEAPPTPTPSPAPPEESDNS